MIGIIATALCAIITILAGFLVVSTSYYDENLYNRLHTTKGHNDEVRGALGTELQNKADWMLEAKYNKNLEVFTMGSRENRYGRHPALEYRRLKSGMPELLSGLPHKQEAEDLPF